MTDRRRELKELRRRLDRRRADHDHWRRQAKAERAARDAARSAAQNLAAAQEFIQRAAAAAQESAHRQVAAVVTRCLAAVFGADAYAFEIRFHRRRGRTEAELVFVRDGKAVDPVDAAGGGVLDVAAFALRLAALTLSRPRRRKLLVLDEPFRHLSSDFRPAVRRLLELLAAETGTQIIMVTHSEALACGTVVEVG